MLSTSTRQPMTTCSAEAPNTAWCALVIVGKPMDRFAPAIRHQRGTTG